MSARTWFVGPDGRVFDSESEAVKQYQYEARCAYMSASRHRGCALTTAWLQYRAAELSAFARNALDHAQAVV